MLQCARPFKDKNGTERKGIERKGWCKRRGLKKKLAQDVTIYNKLIYIYVIITFIICDGNSNHVAKGTGVLHGSVCRRPDHQSDKSSQEEQHFGFLLFF